MDIQVPLNRLRFGHEVGSGINARVIGRNDGIEALAANIHARGLIENLVVKRWDGDLYAVANGNRRLAALRMMYGEDSDQLIACTERDVDEGGAFEDSLATAVLAQQLHPVDQHEAFARLQASGATRDEIAHRYGMQTKQVDQALALGALAPAIRNAWRSGAIKAEVAQAFTLTDDHNKQQKLFDKLSRSGHLYAHLIRKELGVADSELCELMVFAGEEYAAAGGRATLDLFGQHHIVDNPELLLQVADAKIQATCDWLLSQGWSWAARKHDLPANVYSWARSKPKALIYEGDEERRLEDLRSASGELNTRISDLEDTEGVDWSQARRDIDLWESKRDAIDVEIGALMQTINLRSFSDRQKDKSGCILTLVDGRLQVEAGVIKPAEVAKRAGKAPATSSDEAESGDAAAPPAKVEEPTTLSRTHLHRLSLQLTEAAATALVQDLELSLIVILAGIAHRYNGDAIRISVGGLGAHRLDLTGAESIADNIKLLREMSLQDRMALLPAIAAAALNFETRTLDAEAGAESSVAAICNAIDAAAFNAAARGAFDAKDYFTSAPKALVIEAIREAGFVDQKFATKGAAAEFAIANVPATGWLPAQLRAKGYDGPPVQQAPVAAVAPAERKRGKAKPAKTPAKASPARGGKAAKPKVAKAKPAKKAAKKAGKR